MRSDEMGLLVVLGAAVAIMAVLAWALLPYLQSALTIGVVGR